jgi:hypothetical protein
MNDISELGDNFRILSKDQYRIFIKYFDKNYRELYELKETYEVHKIGDNFKVTLSDSTTLDFDNILLEIS